MADALTDVAAQFPRVTLSPQPATSNAGGKGFELTALVLNKLFPSPTLQHVMAAVCDHADREETVYPSAAALAAKTGYSRRTIFNALGKLTRLGLLREVDKRKCASGAVKVRQIVRAALEALPDPPRGPNRKRASRSPQGVHHVHPKG